MIDPNEIEETIDKFVNTRDASFYACSRLADMYIVLDHLRQSDNSMPSATPLVPSMEGSDFLKAASGKRVEDVLRAVDEHLQVIALMYPTTYENILSRIKEL